MTDHSRGYHLHQPTYCVYGPDFHTAKLCSDFTATVSGLPSADESVFGEAERHPCNYLQTEAGKTHESSGK